MENEVVDYSAYVTLQSNQLQTYALLSGFMLTVMILLLTMLPDPSQILAQTTLFVLAIMFTVYMLKVRSSLLVVGFCIKAAPPIPSAIVKYDKVTTKVTEYGGWVVVPLIFLLWNLLYLALTTSIAIIILYAIDSVVLAPISDPIKAWIRK